jgi:hypothetical protein
VYFVLVLPPDNKHLIEQLSRPQIFQDYEKAFSHGTGLPLKLRPTELWQLAQQGPKYENPFCSILSKHSRSCPACLQLQQKIISSPRSACKTVRCFAGLCDTAVPVKAGERLIGFLQTGQVFLKKPTKRQIEQKMVIEWQRMGSSDPHFRLEWKP